MQQASKKKSSRQILGVFRFVTRRLGGMLLGREREIPGRESDGSASSLGEPGRKRQVRINGNRGANTRFCGGSSWSNELPVQSLNQLPSGQSLEVIMTLMKSILLGSAAGIVAVAGAQAADLPTKKAAPAGYVRICNVGGMAGFVIPGSDTCLQISRDITGQLAGSNTKTD